MVRSLKQPVHLFISGSRLSCSGDTSVVISSALAFCVCQMLIYLRLWLVASVKYLKNVTVIQIIHFFTLSV